MKRFGILSLVVLLFVSCGSEEPECRIRSSGEPGIRLLECPSGTVRIAGEGEGVCTVSSEKEGWRRVSCSDGTSVLIDPEGKVHYPGSGSIEGWARLEGGEGDDEGIVVRAEGTPFETRTDAEGRFVLGDLPAGLYRVVLEFPGRVPEIRENVPVVNGSYSLGEIALSASLRLTGDIMAKTIPSPSADSLLVLEPRVTGDVLTLIHLETWERVHLSSNAFEPVYRFDGRKVLWTENLTSRSRLRTYDVDTGEREELPVEGMGAVYFADGRTLLVRQVAEGKNRLLAYDTLTGERFELGSWTPSPLADLPMGPDGGSVVFNAGGQIVLWDRENGERVTLAEAGSTLHDVFFHPSGRQVVIIRRDGNPHLFLFDLARGISTTLETRLVDGPVSCPQDGSLVWRGEAGWKLWGGEGGEVVTLPLPEAEGRRPEILFLPDCSGLLHLDYPLAHLLMRDESTPRLLSAQFVGRPAVTSDAKHILLEVVEDGPPRTRVVRVEDGTSVRLEASEWKLGPDPGWIYRLQANTGALTIFDLEKREGGSIPARLDEAHPGGNDTLLVRAHSTDPNSDRIGIWERSSKKVRWLVRGEEPRLSPNGRYLFFRACPPGVGSGATSACNFLYRYDRLTEEYVRAGESVSWREMHERYAIVIAADGNEDGLFLVRAAP